MVSQPGQGPVALVTEGKEKGVSKTEDKLGIMVFNCLHGQAPPYLVELCQPVTGVTSRGNISDLPHDSSWSYRATDSAFMADGLSVWLVRRFGIPCRTACGIRLLVGTVLGNL